MSALEAPPRRVNELAVTWAVARRGLLAISRMPSILAPTVIFPVFLLVSFTSAFVALKQMPGFPTDNFVNWYWPFVALQGSSFAGAGAGFGAARDITSGFFDRLLLTPSSRLSLLAGNLLAAMIRASIPAVTALPLALALGARFVTKGPLEALGGVLAVFAGCWIIAAFGTLWSLGVAYRAKTERAAPLFFIVLFMALFLSTAQVPVKLMNSAWLRAVAARNPVTHILRLARQGFVTGIHWSDTWPGLVAAAGVGAVLFLWAWTALARYEN